MSLSDIVNSFCDAIAKAEGYGEPDAIPTLANNPGDLAIGDQGFGEIESSGSHGTKITRFETYEQGRAALYRQVQKMFTGLSHVYNPDMTIAEVALKYSGDPNWGINVANHLGVIPETTLRQLADASV